MPQSIGNFKALGIPVIRYKMNQQCPIPFTMLPSVSGFVPDPDQATHVPANTFLDAFAPFCQSTRLRTHAVDSGAIMDIGYTADNSSRLNTTFDHSQQPLINEKILGKSMKYPIFQRNNDWNFCARIFTSQRGVASDALGDNSGV